MRDHFPSLLGEIGVREPSRPPSRLTPGQIRAARGMLGWSRLDLAAAAGLSVSSVKRVEDASPEAVSLDLHAVIRAALEARGVSFLADDGAGPGLRFRAIGAPAG